MYGAALSHQFKTKDIRVTDIVPYDILVSYPAPAKSDSAKPRTINTLIFSSGTTHPKKKTLTLKHKDDLTLQLNYRNSPVP